VKLVERIRPLLERYDRRLWVLFAVQLVVALGFGAAMPFVSLYLYQERGIPMTLVGTMMLCAAVASAVGRILGGELADRIGRKPLVVGAMVLQTGFFLAMAWTIARHAPILGIASAFLAVRFAGSAAEPGISAMVADVVLPERRIEAFGFLRIGGNTGWAIGPAVGGFLLTVSYDSLFLLTAAATLVGAFLVLFLTRESIAAREQEPFSLVRLLDAGRDRRFLGFTVWSLFLFLLVGQFATTLTVFSTGPLGASNVALGFLFTLNGLICVFFQWPASAAAKRLGMRWALVLSSLLYALGYFSVGLVPAAGYLYLSMTVLTFGEILFSPTANAMVANLAPSGKTGRYLGFYGLAEGFGRSAGPFFGGLLLDRLLGRPVVLWGALAGFGVIAAVGFFFLARRIEARTAQEVSRRRRSVPAGRG
jgi:MFS family permease